MAESAVDPRLLEQEIAGLTARCSKILEVLEKGREVAGDITGHAQEEKGVAEQPKQSDQLSNLRHLVDTIAWGVAVLVDQLNRIQNQL